MKEKYTFKDFVPLIVTLVGVIVVTLVLFLGWGETEPLRGMRLFMGTFFVVFGAFKVVRLKAFVQAYQEYDILAQRSTTYAYLYPFIELALGVLYLLGIGLVVVNSVTFIIMAVGAVGVFRKLRKKEHIPCVCLGAVFQIPMTWVTLAEDIVMAVMALVMIVFLL